MLCKQAKNKPFPDKYSNKKYDSTWKVENISFPVKRYDNKTKITNQTEKMITKIYITKKISLGKIIPKKEKNLIV